MWYKRLFTYSCVCFVYVLITQSCPTLCDPTVCNLPGSSVHGILQERTLKWVVITFSWYLPDPGIKPRSLHCRQIVYHLSHREALRRVGKCWTINRKCGRIAQGSGPGLLNAKSIWNWKSWIYRSSNLFYYIFLLWATCT